MQSIKSAAPGPRIASIAHAGLPSLAGIIRERETMNLSLDTRRVGDMVVMKCSGRIIAGDEAQLLQNRFRTLLDEGSDFVLNLGEVNFIDSSGMGTLVRLFSNARSKGGDIKLCALAELVRRIFQLTNLLSVFEIYDSEEQAIAAFYRRQRTARRNSDDGRPRI